MDYFLCVCSAIKVISSGFFLSHHMKTLRRGNGCSNFSWAGLPEDLTIFGVKDDYFLRKYGLFKEKMEIFCVSSGHNDISRQLLPT